MTEPVYLFLMVIAFVIFINLLGRIIFSKITKDENQREIYQIICYLLAVLVLYLFNIGFVIRLDVLVPILSVGVAILFSIWVEKKMKTKYSNIVAKLVSTVSVIVVYFLCISLAKMITC